ncbi:MAG: glycoside hydrolase family 15 protein [Planctomycetota bacterium]
MKFGIIGNCGYSALIDQGSVEWMCWPRLDSSFVFGPMLDREKGGRFTVEMVDVQRVEQSYIENTNILRTEFHGPTGAFELIDFAPRYRQYDRYYKPTMLCRIIRPIYGEPVVRVRCEPVYDYGRTVPTRWLGSNHIAYQGLPVPLRLTTNIPLTYVDEGQPFALTGEKHLALTWGQPLESALEQNLESFFERTRDYWRRWVKHTRTPRDYQGEVIRSALVLKLHQFEDTGAIIAATTTSVPEFPGSGRCWDYRYCWLRDTYFSLHAFERLGHFEEMESFLGYLRNLARRHGDHMLQPLYAINGEDKIVEEILDHLSGYQFDFVDYGPGEGDGPVRIGNQAYEHVQNDVYGEMILAISRLLVDRRFVGVEGRGGIRNLVDQLLTQIENRLEEPDAGLWELRNTQKLHSFSLLTHWAGAQRAVEIGEELGDAALRTRSAALAAEARRILEERCWDADRGVLTQAAGFKNLDAAMLLALHFGFFAPDDPRAKSHVLSIKDQLETGGLLKRYDVEDDFGDQEAAFTVCSFWLVEALAIVGETAQAKELFEFLLERHNGLGLYSEDLMPDSGRLTGNFPQTYSHVGLINAAFRLSRSWD